MLFQPDYGIMCFRKAEDGPSREKGKVKKMKKNEELKKRAVPGQPLPDPKEASRRVRAWLLRTHPEEEPMIGDFRKGVTFAEINRRMHNGEDFYDICECTESDQREYVFHELARIYKTEYNFWYYLWLGNGRKDPMYAKALKALKKDKKLKHLFKKG